MRLAWGLSCFTDLVPPLPNPTCLVSGRAGFMHPSAVVQAEVSGNDLLSPLEVWAPLLTALSLHT